MKKIRKESYTQKPQRLVYKGTLKTAEELKQMAAETELSPDDKEEIEALIEYSEKARMANEAFRINRDELDEDRTPIGAMVDSVVDDPLNQLSQQRLFQEALDGEYDDIEEAPLSCPVEYETDEETGEIKCISGYRVMGVRQDKASLKFQAPHSGVIFFQPSPEEMTMGEKADEEAVQVSRYMAQAMKEETPYEGI